MRQIPYGTYLSYEPHGNLVSCIWVISTRSQPASTSYSLHHLVKNIPLEMTPVVREIFSIDSKAAAVLLPLIVTHFHHYASAMYADSYAAVML